LKALTKKKTAKKKRSRVSRNPSDANAVQEKGKSPYFGIPPKDRRVIVEKEKRLHRGMRGGKSSDPEDGQTPVQLWSRDSSQNRSDESDLVHELNRRTED